MKRLYILMIMFAIYGKTISCSKYKYKYHNIDKFCSAGNRYKTIELDNDEDDSAIILRSGDNYKNNLDCAVYVEAERGYSILVTVKRISLRRSVDKLEIEINRSNLPDWTTSNVKDNKELISYVADRKVKIQFSSGYSSESTKNKGFELILTTYRVSNKCGKYEFSCGNSRCISSFYQCDGHNNCGNNKDEIGCSEQTNNFAIIGGLLGALVALLLLCYCWRCCCGKSKKRLEYVEFINDKKGSEKIEHQKTNTEPSAPISPSNHVDYGSTGSYKVRYPVNPNYPYFIDGTAPPYPVPLSRPQSSTGDPFSHLPPPPPYSPRDQSQNNDNNDSHHSRDETSK
jgi:hypothetical protein